MQIQNSSHIEIQPQQFQQVRPQLNIDSYSPEKIKDHLQKQYRKFKVQKQNTGVLNRLCWNILHLFTTLKLILQQLWCQLVPIFIRGRRPGELIMIQRHKNAYFGCTSNLLYKLVNEKYFFLIIYQNQSPQQKGIFEVINQKHLLIIQDTKTLFINQQSKQYTELGFQRLKKGFAPGKYPQMHICKKNICMQLISFASIQLTDLSAEDLNFLVREVQGQIVDYRGFQEQVTQRVENRLQSNIDL